MPTAIFVAFVVNACGPGVYIGSRVVMSLAALDLGASPAMVGLLSGLYGLLPIFLSVPFGRLVDRRGVRPPMIALAAATLIALLAPFAELSYATLAIGGLAAGVASMAFTIGATKAVAVLSTPERRAGQLGWLGAAAAIGSILAPVAFGFSIDQVGHRVTFGLVALVPVLAIAVLVFAGGGLPGPSQEVPARGSGSMLQYWRDPPLRKMLLLCSVVPMAMDTYSFLIPVIGSSHGWSASLTGLVVGSLGGAVLLSRILLPWSTRRFGPWALIGASFLSIAIGYLAMPLIELPMPMAGVALLIGVGCGIAPPVLSALLYAASPPGRQGEVIGLRIMLQFGAAGAAPVAVGALATPLGIAPVVCAMGGGMAWAARASFRERGIKPPFRSPVKWGQIPIRRTGDAPPSDPPVSSG